MDNFSKELIEAKLRQAALALIREETMRFAADILEEESQVSSVPGIVKWHAGPGVDSRRSYQYRNPDTQIHYTIQPSKDAETPYTTFLFHPDDSKAYSLGSFTDPNSAANAAREHHDAVTGVNDEALNESSEAIKILAEAGFGFGAAHSHRKSKFEKEREVYYLSNEYKHALRLGRNGRELRHRVRLKLSSLGYRLRDLGL